MFDTLSDRLERLSSSLRSRGRLSEADVDSALSEVRTALLEADVEVGVVRAFTAAVKERLTGEVLSAALSPGQQVIKAVHEQLVEVLGGIALSGLEDLLEFVLEVLEFGLSLFNCDVTATNQSFGVELARRPLVIDDFVHQGLC